MATMRKKELEQERKEKELEDLGKKLEEGMKEKLQPDVPKSKRKLLPYIHKDK